MFVQVPIFQKIFGREKMYDLTYKQFSNTFRSSIILTSDNLESYERELVIATDYLSALDRVNGNCQKRERGRNSCSMCFTFSATASYLLW